MAASLTALHIIEPTLADQAGHCYGYVRSLVRANQHFHVHVWLDRRGRALFEQDPCQVHPYFFRQLRKLQKIFCLRALLAARVPIFIATAGRVDLVMLDRLLGSHRHPHNIFLHFHQFRVTPSKTALLHTIAARHPELIILTSTPQLMDIFKEAGFQRCQSVPCPGYESVGEATHLGGRFEKLIYAGAARADKGFPQVVDFVEYIINQALAVPITLQISPPFSGRYDAESKAALTKLQRLSHPQLTLHRHTLAREAYQRLFHHAIALLIYDPHSYHNKFSGVAFDAFSAGCPVIAMQDTWAGEVVKRLAAGIVLSDRSPETVYEAVTSIRKNYPYYYQKALLAGKILQKEHDPAHTLTIIKNYITET